MSKHNGRTLYHEFRELNAHLEEAQYLLQGQPHLNHKETLALREAINRAANRLQCMKELYYKETNHE